MGPTNDIINIVQKLRKRLAEFRYEHIGHEQSIHINTVEIALGLVDFAIQVNRKIMPDELQWFHGGKSIEDVLGNSKWEDIADLYYELITVAQKKNLIS